MAQIWLRMMDEQQAGPSLPIQIPPSLAARLFVPKKISCMLESGSDKVFSIKKC